jgi:aminopeptidase N
MGCGPLTAYRLPLTAYLLVAAPLAAQAPLAGRWDRFRGAHDAIHYAVTLVLPDTGASISADVTIRWRLGGPGPIRLELDSAMTLRAVAVDARPVRWRRPGDRIEIPVSGKPGSLVTTRIRYDGPPSDGLLLRGAGPTRTIFADNWPNRAHLWLASQDHPADKATVSWTIEAPTGFRVVANGKLVQVDKLPPNQIRWHFENPEPIPVYTMVVGMARFAVTELAPACAVRCVPVSLLSYPEDSAFAAGGPFRRAAEMVDFFATRIARFPYGELRHVESSTRFGGMENSTAIFYDEKAYRERRLREGVVAHETMHQWFGDAVTELDWHHIWLSEGFATYGEALWAEHLGGDSGLQATMQRFKEEILASPASSQPVLDSAEQKLFALLNTNSYQKGSWVLHSLRGLLGDTIFFRGLTEYYRTYEHKNALSSDFARVMGRVAGRDLGWYFRQALTQPGYPVLEVQSELEGGHLVLTLRQVQQREWGLYRIPNLEVRLDDRVLRVSLSGRVTRLTTHWAGSSPPARVKVDPEGWWLLKVSGER